MTMHVRDAGTWKTVTAPSVRDAGTWKTVTGGWVRDAGTWKQFFSGLAVNEDTLNISWSNDAALVYAGVELRNDGTTYRNLNGGVSAIGPLTDWLASGTAAEVWVERVISSGTLNSLDPGTGRLQLNTTRYYRVVDGNIAGGAVVCVFTLNFYDAASGGNLLGSTSVTLSANREVAG